MTSYKVLRDGRRVAVRALRPTDRRQVAAVLEAMSDNARYQRFLRPMPRIGRHVVDALAGADGVNHIALLAEHEHEPAGMGRIVLAGDAAELAVEIRDEFVGIGLGRYLTETLLTMAGERGVAEVELYVAPDNVGARRLFSRLGARFRVEDGVLRGVLPTAKRHRAA